jgi:hypothetical protein
VVVVNGQTGAMRTPVVAAVSGAVGLVVGAVAAVAVANADDPVDRADASVQARPAACADVITDKVLATLDWSDPATRPEERLARCEWFGEPGNITVGTQVAPLSEKCEEASTRDGYEASTSWLAEPTLEDGCVVVNEKGIGLYEVLTEIDGEVVQVRVALLDERPVDDVRAALRLLVAASA